MAVFGAELAFAGRRSRIFLHEASEILHIVYLCFGQNSVTQIEDVPRASGRALQNVFGSRLQLVPFGEQQYRVQISLQQPCARADSNLRRAECASPTRSTSAPVSFIAGRSVALSVPK